MKTLTKNNRFQHLGGVCMVGVVVALSFLVEVCFGSFPVGLFRFPLNVLQLAMELWSSVFVEHRDRMQVYMAREQR